MKEKFQPIELRSTDCQTRKISLNNINKNEAVWILIERFSMAITISSTIASTFFLLQISIEQIDGDSAKPVTESRAVQVPFLNNKCVSVSSLGYGMNDRGILFSFHARER